MSYVHLPPLYLIYSAVILILHDLFCTNEEGPIRVETYCAIIGRHMYNTIV